VTIAAPQVNPEPNTLTRIRSPFFTLPCVRQWSSGSGEQRISNFMLWEIAYAELLFTEVLQARLKSMTLAGGGTTVSLLLAVVLPGLFFLFRFRDIPTVANRLTATVMGIVYAGFLSMFLAKLKLIDPVKGGDTVLIVLLIAWLADTGGYFAGRFLGKSKLYEAVSPKKTWAGAYGGIAGSIAGVAALKLISAPWLSWFDVFALAIPGASSVSSAISPSR